LLAFTPLRRRAWAQRGWSFPGDGSSIGDWYPAFDAAVADDPKSSTRENPMPNKALLAAATALLCATAPAPVLAKGCVRGAIVGGVAGHYVGHGHALAGAAAGCVIAHHHYAQQAKARREAARHH